MTPIKRVAVAGATGYVGFPLANALLDSGVFEVLVLVRATSIDAPRVHQLKERGAQVQGVSYDDEEQLTKLLEGVDVVISTLSYASVESQIRAPLMKACVSTGVKLFFPSEFALELANDTESSASKTKKQVIALAKTLGLPFVRIFNGLFPEWYISHTFYQFYPSENRVTIYGSGDEKNAWTSVDDVARFVAYILEHVPLSQLVNQKLRIEGDAKSFNEFVTAWEEKHNVKLQVTYKPISELDERIVRNPADHEAATGRDMFYGRAAAGPVANSLFPSWNPKQLNDAI